MKALCLRYIRALILVFFISNLIGSQQAFAHPVFETYEFGNISTSPSLDSVEQTILELVNKERRKKGLNSLIWDAKLGALASFYSNKMAKDNFFSHTDSKGNNLVKRAEDFNITWSGLSENLYFCKGFDDPAHAAFDGWVKSPTHLANLLGRSWSATGIGIAETKEGKFYATQIFLKR